jgi:hypothetical protein
MGFFPILFRRSSSSQRGNGIRQTLFVGLSSFRKRAKVPFALLRWSDSPAQNEPDALRAVKWRACVSQSFIPLMKEYIAGLPGMPRTFWSFFPHRTYRR